MDRDILYFQMNMLQAEIKMQGMIAENLKHMADYEYPKYTEDDFNKLVEEYDIHHNAFPYYQG